MTAIDYRRALHRIPEVGWDLPETYAAVRGFLQDLPCKLVSPAPNALCAFFDFGKEDAIAFRSDMDALPVEEATALPFASQHPGKMHACGHDGHMAALLAFAHAIPGLKARHNILLIFQPAEETIGGAKVLCDAGIFETYNVKAVFGMHLWPGLPLGTVASIPGGMMVRASELTLTVTGKSVHVAKSAQGRDAMDAAVRWYTAALEIEKQVPKEEFHLLKFGHFTAGTVRNALAGSARLEGTIRALNDDIFHDMRSQLVELTERIARETGCELDLHFTESYPPVWNDESLLQKVQTLTPIHILEEPSLIAEDFSNYQRVVPGVFFYLGLGDVPALHSANFNFDDSVLETGADLWKTIIEGI